MTKDVQKVIHRSLTRLPTKHYLQGMAEKRQNGADYTLMHETLKDIQGRMTALQSDVTTIQSDISEVKRDMAEIKLDNSVVRSLATAVVQIDQFRDTQVQNMQDRLDNIEQQLEQR